MRTSSHPGKPRDRAAFAIGVIVGVLCLLAAGSALHRRIDRHRLDGASSGPELARAQARLGCTCSH